MLGEIVQFLQSEVRPEFRKLGYLRQAVALAARSRRQPQAWLSHQQQSRQVIGEALAQCQGRQRVVVLGSGLLQEIPLDELSRNFAEVVLVDTVFLPQTRAQLAGYGNVRMLEEDITGLTLSLLAHRSKRQALPEPQSPIPRLAEGCDLLISANVLSQLPLLPLQYIVRRFRYDNEDLVDWGERIIRDHLGALLQAGCRTVLITDSVHEERDRRGRVLRREDMLFRVRLPDAAWQWPWQLAPMGEAGWRREVVAQMVAFSDFPYPYLRPGHGQADTDLHL